LAAVVVWALASSLPWLLSALLLFSVVPLTLIVIFPTNKKLHDPLLQPTDPAAAQLFLRWGRLHWLRTLLSGAAFALQVAALIGR
jgi:hypothetical protein